MFYQVQARRRVASTQSRRQPEATELLPLPERPYNPRRGVHWRCVHAVYSQVRPFTHDRICTLTLGVTFAQTPYQTPVLTGTISNTRDFAVPTDLTLAILP